MQIEGPPDIDKRSQHKAYPRVDLSGSSVEVVAGVVALVVGRVGKSSEGVG